MEIDCGNLATRKEQRHNGDMTGVVTSEDVLRLRGRRNSSKNGKGQKVVPYLVIPVHSMFY